MLAGYLNRRVRTVSSGFGYWNSEPKPELSIRSGCRTKPENHFMLRTAFEPRSFYPATFSDCHKTDTDLSPVPVPSYDHLGFSFCIASLHLPFQIFPSSFHISSLPFFFFASWSCWLLFINLFCLLHGAVHFSSLAALSPLSYWPRYSFLSMILLTGRLMCLFILWKDVFIWFK